MPATLTGFLETLPGSPHYILSLLLLAGAMAVNGATDAPNSVAAAVSSYALPPKFALRMSALFCFIGVMTAGIMGARVTETLFEAADFGSGDPALRSLCAVMVTIIVWAGGAWYFGIPTSESHALLAALGGASVAYRGDFGALDPAAWSRVFTGLIFSVSAGFFGGFIICKIIRRLLKNSRRDRPQRFFRRAQRIGAAANSFMHGAQDGQKFIGMLLLIVNGGAVSGGFSAASGEKPGGIPTYAAMICAAAMAAGIYFGGYRIIKSMGMDMVRLGAYQGASSDAASAAALLVSTLLGYPVSTTHTKSCAIMGAGAAHRLRSVDFSVARNMVLTWLLTFPACALLGFLFTKIFLAI